MFRTFVYFGLWAIFASFLPTVHSEHPVTFESLAAPFLEQHCVDCHGADSQEGEIAFHELTEINPQNAELWQRIWEQVALQEMPPKDEDNQPAALQRLQLTNFITSELQRVLHDQGGFQKHLHPSKGNHLDHDLLFGELPAGLEPASTPARIWRIHPQEQLTRLSALINREPDFDPDRPGLRARGDFIPPNEDGEVKVYFGLDRVIGWVGGTAAYAAAITGFPPILATEDNHGLRDYCNLYSVNGPEATQIASTAENILRFMAFGPQAESYQFADDVKEIDEKYKDGDLRGLAQSVFYAKETKRPLTPVYDLLHSLQDGADVSNKKLQVAVDYLFNALSGRQPTEEESQQYVDIAQEAIIDLGPEEGAILGLVPIFLDRDALFRTELAEQGTPDEFGRVMLQDQELGLAINAAFCYLPPNEKLQQAIEQGQLRTREDVQREITRMLTDDSIRKPRVLQFFREYFDYDRAGRICKDAAALLSAGGSTKTQDHYRTMFDMTASTDRLIELILKEDKDVLRQLLTTDRVVFNAGIDNPYFGEYVSSKQPPKDPDAKKNAAQRRVTVKPISPPTGETVHVRIAQVVQVGKTARSKTERSLTTLPVDQRMGLLTHPSWLVSHSDAMDNHAIHRGKWIRERLLGGAVADVPITVDAMLPDEPTETLRHRMRVTREDYCWKCHQKMDPLGLPFEMYNHLGLYRRVEQDQPVDTTGAIIDSGDPTLDGPVENALELIQRLANSQRVQQVFVRHAFRFWMGRNETINDAPVLQDAYTAYRTSGGSMKALLTSLLTSDAFLYRTVEREPSESDFVMSTSAQDNAKSASPVSSPSAHSVSSSPPNFVVIFADDQGYQDIGCFGSPDIRTPRLDTLAAEGMKFTSFYAQPICGPSRAALMTGCYPLRVAERGNVKQVHPVLHSDEITVAEVLKTQGYATACFGKWDLATHSQTNFFDDLLPTRQGFDYFYGTPTSNDKLVNLYRNAELIEENTDMSTLTQRYTDEAIEFIQHHQEQPFFVYLPHTMPHTRLDASEKFKGKSPRGLYGDVIEEIDFNVGRIIDVLNDLKLAENTYVLFTSDNGPWLIKNKNHADGNLPSDHGGSAGPLRSGKVSTFEGGVRVPCIVWGPGRVPAGTTCDAIASTLDVLPTLASLAGAELPSDRVIDGEDIQHLLRGDFDQANADKAYYYYLRVHLQAVRQGKWKLHLPRDQEPLGAAPFAKNNHIAVADRVGFDSPFLVDLEKDIGESTNVADQHPTVVQRLLALAEAMREDLGDFDRVGTNMRFFDLTDERPARPPVPESDTNKQQLQRKPAAELIRSSDPRAAVLGYSSRDIEGWQVRVSDKLAEHLPSETRRAIELLTEQLRKVADILPAEPLAFSRTVTIWLSPEYDGIRPTGEYHPGARWLKEQGRSPELLKCIEFTNIAIFDREIQRMPVLVLHELAHAYHDQVLGFDNLEIKAAFERARSSGIYESVERNNGQTERAYGITNEREYFAESTEALFGINDFYPFERSELERHDPDMAQLLLRLWQVEKQEK